MMVQAGDLLTFNNVSIRAGGGGSRGPRLIRNLDLVVRKGTLTILLGPNGAGKTTLLKAMAGLIRPDGGTVSFGGKFPEIADLGRIGYLSEAQKMPACLSPLEMLIFRARMFGLSQPAVRARECCVTFDLCHFAGTACSRLSRGQKTRLAWALAAIHQPELLILDEPFQGLDPPSRQELFGWLRGRSRDGVGIVMCTHELAMIPPPWDQLIVLNAGRVRFHHGGRPPWPTSEQLLAAFKDQDKGKEGKGL